MANLQLGGRKNCLIKIDDFPVDLSDHAIVALFLKFITNKLH